MAYVSLTSVLPALLKIKKTMKKIEKMPPVIVAIPNTSVQKMDAIVNISQAILVLAKALNSTNVECTISNCHIESSGVGISIKTDDHCNPTKP
jgi:endonuclease IV